MSTVKFNSYYMFSHLVSSKQRYILNDEAKDFLEFIADTCQERVHILKPGATLWRAQLGHRERPHYDENPETGEQIYITDIPTPYAHDRMKPLRGAASEGRVNPKGIPYLYVANNRETAMSEVRPWLHSVISIASLKTNKELKIVDFSVQHGKNNIDIHLKLYESSLTIEDIKKAIWCDIDNAFSRPVNQDDLTTDYIPTQIISEFIREQGYDGIAYKSMLGNSYNGYNIALFDLDAADVVRCFLYKTENVTFDFKQEPM